jgi:hypothetical protein
MGETQKAGAREHNAEVGRGEYRAVVIARLLEDDNGTSCSGDYWAIATLNAVQL